jgi:hypothetical protein
MEQCLATLNARGPRKTAVVAWAERTKAWSICTAAAFEESDVEVNLMRAFWEQVGALGPIYCLVGQGLSDRDIATKLNLTEPRVQACIAWILQFLGLTNRNELIRYAATPTAR